VSKQFAVGVIRDRAAEMLPQPPEHHGGIDQVDVGHRQAAHQGDASAVLQRLPNAFDDRGEGPKVKSRAVQVLEAIRIVIDGPPHAGAHGAQVGTRGSVDLKFPSVPAGEIIRASIRRIDDGFAGHRGFARHGVIP